MRPSTAETTIGGQPVDKYRSTAVSILAIVAGQYTISAATRVSVLIAHELTASSFLTARLNFLAQRPLCRLADLFNAVENLLALPFVY